MVCSSRFLHFTPIVPSVQCMVYIQLVITAGVSEPLPSDPNMNIVCVYVYMFVMDRHDICF